MNLTDNEYCSLDRGSVRQDNTNTDKMHEPSAVSGEDISCRGPQGSCDLYKYADFSTPAVGFLVLLQFLISYCAKWTGWCGGNAVAQYPGNALFESRPVHWLTWLRSFVVLLSPSRERQG